MEHPKARNANSARRNRVRTAVLAEETHCGICGGLVDKTLTVLFGQHGPKCSDSSCPGCTPHPMRPEVDEIIPFSRGGSPYDRSNCRLTHRTCNINRGDGQRSPTVAREQLPTIGDY